VIDFWSRALKFFDIKKVPNISGLDVGVNPVALRENPRLFKTKSLEEFQDLKWELIP
jgi:hypothetical protein